MKTLLALTNDQEVIDHIQLLLKSFPNWELQHYADNDIAWMKFLRKEPDLAILDFDLFDSDAQAHPDRLKVFLDRAPLLVVISSENMRNEGYREWIIQLQGMDYLKKPISLDRLVFLLSVAAQPRQVVQ